MLEREFLAESRAASQRQLEQQRRANRRLRTLLAGTAIFLAVAVVAGLFALVQRNHARSAQRTAQAQALQSDAERVGTLAQTEPNLDLSLLLAVAGVKLEDRPETRGDLLAALQRTPSAFRFIRPSTSEITAIAISPDGKLMATGDAAGAVRFEDLRHLDPAARPSSCPPRCPPSACVLPRRADGGGGGGKGDLSQVFLIDVGHAGAGLIGSWAGRSPAHTQRLDHPGLLPRRDRTSRSGCRTGPLERLTRRCHEQIVLLDAVHREGRVAAPLSGARRPSRKVQVAFTPDGTLVTSAEQGTTDLWNAHTGRIVRQFPVGGRFALSPDGRQAAIG